jgi:Zn-dependent M16 (insulinase) family peptidase
MMQNLSAEQQEAIQAIGFRSLLKLKDLRIRRNLCKQIADTYDLQNEEFNINGDRLRITLRDVDQILGLPHEGDEINELPKKRVLRLLKNSIGKKVIALLS